MFRMRNVVLLLIFALLLIWPGGRHSISATEDVADISLELVIQGLGSPLFLTHAGDDSGRLFVVEQGGRIRVIQPGDPTTIGSTVFLNITDRVLAGGERGLLGLAFHPDYAVNGRFFVNYTRRPDGATVIAEYRVSSDPNEAVNDESTILTIAQPFSNHNGGMIAFGPDGYLYIATGDGGSANDPQNNAQNINNLLGKILRIDVDRSDPPAPYAVPPDNPFFGAVPGRDEIYAFGLRNPFRFSFDRLTGELYAGDVGQNAREEIDIITLGGNYGWRVFEGTRCTNLGPAPCVASNFIPPIFEYDRAGGRCAVTGGFVYRGIANSLPFGAYIFGDFCSGEIMMLRNAQFSVLVNSGLSISSFGEDEDGELYVISLGGSVHRIRGKADPGPEPEPETGPVLDSVFVRRRSTGAVLNPVTIQPNGKKYDIIVEGRGFVDGADIRVNERKMIKPRPTDMEGQIRAKLRKKTIREPAFLEVLVENPDGSRSNSITVQVVDPSQIEEPAPDPDPPPDSPAGLELIVDGLEAPLFATGSGDGSGRLFIVEQSGRIKVLDAESDDVSVFLDISHNVRFSGDFGLLGLAFHPNYSENGSFYVFYTRASDGAAVVAEYLRSPSEPKLALADERTLLVMPRDAIHHGGMLAFGADGFLYISTGDAGFENDPLNAAQDLSSLNGKVLRIDVDQSSEFEPYGIPFDNPFRFIPDARGEIWAYGFRNPHRFSFDRVAGTLYLGDVGQDLIEEVNIVLPGANYGWRVFEGTQCTMLDPDLCDGLDFIAPIFEYEHLNGRCSVTGGYVYRGAKRALPLGAYVFGDFCSGEIFVLFGSSFGVLRSTDMMISSFGQDDDGEILVIDYMGSVYRIVVSEATEDAAAIRSRAPTGRG